MMNLVIKIVDKKVLRKGEMRCLCIFCCKCHGFFCKQKIEKGNKQCKLENIKECTNDGKNKKRHNKPTVGFYVSE